jgi:heat shock protein HspQ
LLQTLRQITFEQQASTVRGQERPALAGPQEFADVTEKKTAKFAIGQVVRHRLFPFRGVIFDVDPEFNNTDEWYEAIPAEIRPRKDQPFYHLLAENDETEYIAYVSEQNLLADQSGDPIRHPQLREFFDKTADGSYAPKRQARH